MSSRFSQEITKLAAEARHHSIHDHDTIKELTMVMGLAYLVELHPQCSNQLRKHLQAFIDLACTRGHRELYEHSSKIMEMSERNDGREAA
jgi:hypothetical protein